MMWVWFKLLMWGLASVDKKECKLLWLAILPLLSFDILPTCSLYMEDGHIWDCARYSLVLCSVDLCIVQETDDWCFLLQVITYFFYKNLTFTLTQFWFTFQTGFSGQRFYDDWFQSLYNVIFTALPVIMVGLFDKVCNLYSFLLMEYTILCALHLTDPFQDVSASLSKKYPKLYQEGIRNTFFKWRVIAVWAFFAFYQSIVFYYFTAAASRYGHGSSGKILGLWDVSTMAFTCVVVTVNLRLLMSCNSITRWHYISVAGSITAWFMFIFIYSAIMTSFDRQVG